MGKCWCVLLTLLPSVFSFTVIGNIPCFTMKFIQSKTQGCKVNNLYNRKRSRDLFDFWKLPGFYNNLSFWEHFEVLSWFEETILLEKEEQVLKFSFQQLLVEVLLKQNIINFLKRASMNGIGYQFLKIRLSEMLTHYES